VDSNPNLFVSFLHLLAFHLWSAGYFFIYNYLFILRYLFVIYFVTAHLEIHLTVAAGALLALLKPLVHALLVEDVHALHPPKGVASGEVAQADHAPAPHTTTTHTQSTQMSKCIIAM
jgi:hypothetical protein